MNKSSDLIRQLFNKKSISITGLSKKLGYSNAAINNAINRNTIKLSMAEEILNEMGLKLCVFDPNNNTMDTLDGKVLNVVTNEMQKIIDVLKDEHIELSVDQCNELLDIHLIVVDCNNTKYCISIDGCMLFVSPFNHDIMSFGDNILKYNLNTNERIHIKTQAELEDEYFVQVNEMERLEDELEFDV